jgi:diguanylate cyclase (GGDEF)-like protein
MHLDLPSFMVMQSFAVFCAGAVLVVASLQQRSANVLALWGAAHIFAAFGTLVLVLGKISGTPIWFLLAVTLFPLRASLIWKASRILDNKEAPCWLTLLGPMAAFAIGAAPGLSQISRPFSLFVGTAYVVATALTLWQGRRRERLAARTPLIVLSGLHAAAMLVGIYSMVSSSYGPDAVPEIFTLFGFLYFESIVYALGTAVFVFALIKERSEAAGLLAARTDPLTGIANRTAFLEIADNILERCRRNAVPVSVVMFDLDHFKRINDRHGHATGDEVIRSFCEVARTSLRPNDAFGRIGGEEFAVMLAGCGIEAAFVRAERIRIAFAETSRFARGRQVRATLSAGVAGSATATETVDELLEHADAALYRAKSDGRDCVKRAETAGANGPSSNIFRVA